MGFFKSLHEINKEAKDIRKTWDPNAQMKAGMERMAGAQAMMAEQTKAAKMSLSGRDVQVTVVSATPTNAQINFDPVIQIDVTVFPPAGPPYPASVTQPVPQLYLAKVQAGGTLRGKVDPSDPSTLWLDLVNS